MDKVPMSIPYFFLKVSNKMCYEVLISAADDVMNLNIF